ncbi:MAG: hypothetical protein JXL85_01635 [Bacilli bacterium]|nr:hypothetical protein [Bacilli bacterium]
MTSFNRWLNHPNHRLFVFVLVLFVSSWFVVLPQVQLGLFLLDIKGIPQVANLSQIKDLTWATRLVANALDTGFNLKLFTASIHGIDLVFWILLILFALSKSGCLTWIYQSTLVLQVFINLLFMVRFWQLSAATNPTAALAWLTQLGYLHLILGSISLLLMAGGFIWMLIKLDANALHEDEEV